MGHVKGGSLPVGESQSPNVFDADLSLLCPYFRIDPLSIVFVYSLQDSEEWNMFGDTD